MKKLILILNITLFSQQTLANEQITVLSTASDISQSSIDTTILVKKYD